MVCLTAPTPDLAARIRQYGACSKTSCLIDSAASCDCSCEPACSSPVFRRPLFIACMLVLEHLPHRQLEIRRIRSDNCLPGAGTTADAPRDYTPEGDPVSKMFNAFNGLGIMVCALLSLDIMSLLFMVLAASYLPVIFLGKSNAVILCDLYKSPNQDPSVCRPLHTESLCFQVSSDRFS